MPDSLPAPNEDSRKLLPFLPTLVLLTLACIINYIDRGNISVAAPLVKLEFGLSASQLGILFAAFFVTYTAGQFVFGWLVDRFDAGRILVAGFLLWSLATAATGLAGGFAMLLVMRLVLGVGEAVALPSGTKLLGLHLAEHHRGLGGGALVFGMRSGNMFGALGAGLLMAKFGWRPVFLWIGLVSLLWLPAWRKWKPTEVPGTMPARAGGPGAADILRQRSFWGTCAGHFCSNYPSYFMATWLPSYLVFARHLPLQRMALVAGSYYLAEAFSAISTGWLQDMCIRKGYSPSLVRKSAMAVGFAITCAALLACAMAGTKTYWWWLLVSGVGCGSTCSGLFAVPQTLAGAQAVGKWFGWQNGFGNLAGVICPAVTGFVLEKTGSFLPPFGIAAGVCVLGALAWLVVVGRVEQVHWKAHPRTGVEIVGAPTTQVKLEGGHSS